MSEVATNDPRPVGRPTKYRPEMVEEIRSMGPMTASKIGEALDISMQTLYRWMHEIPEFSDAVLCARRGLVVRLEDAMIGQAEGTIQGSSGAGIWMLKNLAPEQYRDRREHRIEVEEVGTIEIDLSGFEDEAEDAEFYELEG